MKIKCKPEDFRVEELPAVTAGGQGPFVFYRLRKRGMGTLEAVEAICRRWNLPAARVQYGGLKDRHADTVQYLSIFNGPDQVLEQASFVLEPLGRLNHPYGPSSFRGNRFGLVIRDLDRASLAAATAAAEQVGAEGVPNYFDDQRFGSVGFDGGFVGEAWLKGQHEEALRLALAEANPSDRPGTRAEKEALRAHWGNWAAAKSALGRSHTRSIVTYLVDHPADFKGAFARVNRALRSLYFSAFQSALWNEWLGAAIERRTRPEQRTLFDFKVARLPLIHGLDPAQAAELRGLALPLPGARVPAPEGPDAAAIEAILAQRGLSWGDLRVRGLKDVFLSKGDRPAVFVPANLRATPAEDDLYPRKQQLDLSFELPRGAYATLVVKRLTEVAGPG